MDDYSIGIAEIILNNVSAVLDKYLRSVAYLSALFTLFNLPFDIQVEIYAINLRNAFVNIKNMHVCTYYVL